MMSPISLVIDRSFRGVGRIKKATGTTIPALKRKMSRMLTDLADNGRIEILRSIRDGHITIAEVWSAYQRKSLHELPTGNTIHLLSDAMKEWIGSLRVPAEASKKHIGSLQTSMRYFIGENAKARISDLPAVLESLRNTLGVEHPRSFNLARSAALAFVRQTMKKSHPLWLAISAVEVRKVEKSEKRRPITPDVMRNLFPSLTDPIDAIAWGMATTGMGQREYWGKWHVETDRVHIDGTKRVGRTRDVPLVLHPSVPRMHRRTFEDKVRERTTIITPYDLRRTYANWMESAGIPRTRRKLYMGHGAADVTDLYERHEVAAFLIEDAAKLRAFLNVVPTKTNTIELVGEQTA